MNVNVYNAVAAILETDPSLTEQDKEVILRVCRSPGTFSTDKQEPARLLTTTEAIKRLHISRSTLWRLTKEGRIKVVRIREDGIPRYREEEIEALTGGG